MATTDTHDCASCGVAAHRRCTGCLEGVDVNGTLSTPFYCSAVCQKAHWSEHKKVCTPSNHRKQMYNSGKLLQELFFETRRVCFDLPIGRVEEKGGQLLVYERSSLASEGMLTRFASEHFKTVEDTRAMLSVASCSEPLLKMVSVVKDALKGCYKTLHEVDFQQGCKHRAIFIQLDGETPLFGQDAHVSIKIHLKDGTHYALDLTGAQFGHHRVVTPWHQYLEIMGMSHVNQHPLGTITQRAAGNFKQQLKLGMEKVGKSDIARGDANDMMQYWLGRCLESEVMLWTTKNEKTLQELVQSNNSDHDREAFVSAVSAEFEKSGNWLSEGGFQKLLARLTSINELGRDLTPPNAEMSEILEKLRLSDKCVDGIDLSSLKENYIPVADRIDIEKRLRAHGGTIYRL